MTRKLCALFSALFSLLSLSCQPAFSAAEKLIFAVDVIRHGDRAPLTALPNDPYVWSNGLGQLTPKGLQDEFKLGTKLRKRYIDEHHLLPSSYLPGTIYARSTDIDRTLMSAQCVLLGLYPLGTGPKLAGDQPALPSAFQPIPVHSRPRIDDWLLNFDTLPRVKDGLSKLVFASPEWQKHTDAVKPKLERWGKSFGTAIGDLKRLSDFGDIVHIYQIHNVALPKELSKDDVEQIINSGEWAYAALFKPREVGDAASHDLLTAVFDYFEQAVQQKNQLKFVLFSAHDSTVSSLMSALGAPLDERPPYASDVTIELFQVGNEYVVKYLFNDKSFETPETKNGAASLSQFKTLVESSGVVK